MGPSVVVEMELSGFTCGRSLVQTRARRPTIGGTRYLQVQSLSLEIRGTELDVNLALQKKHANCMHIVWLWEPCKNRCTYKLDEWNIFPIVLTSAILFLEFGFGKPLAKCDVC
jgi:hypothetical protein